MNNQKTIFLLSDTLKHKAKLMELFATYLKNYEKDSMSLMSLLLKDFNGDDKEFLKEYTNRIINHDLSKLNSKSEYDIYEDVGYKLQKFEYGSKEYNEIRPQLDEGFALHAQGNSHHPEHYASLEKIQQDGLHVYMPIEDILEMILDWCAAALCRGRKLKFSICEQHKEKFNISDDLMNLIYKEIYLILDEKDIDDDINYSKK